jgi:hemoglobin
MIPILMASRTGRGGSLFRTQRLSPARTLARLGTVTSLYEHAGGEAGLHRLEDLFYGKVLRDPLLVPLFGKGRPEHVDHLTWFTAESFGGPDRFSRELGFAHLIEVHRGLKITEEQRARFVELYLEALDEAGMPDDEAFRTAVREHVEFGTHVAMQNSNAVDDAGLHPLREVPHWTWAGDG